MASVNHAEHIALKLGRPGSERRGHFDLAGHLLRNGHFEHVRERFLHGAQVLLHDLVTLAAIGVADGLANGFNGLIAGQDLGDGEEAGLQNGVHARAHAGFARHLIGVNDEEAGLLGDQLGLDFARQLGPNLVLIKRTVEQENAARNQGAEHVVAFEENPLMAGHEVGFGDQIARPDRLRPETQVRNRHRARLLRVVDEVALSVVVGVFADDLDRVLVRAHGAIRAEAVEHGSHHVVGLDGKIGIVIEAGMAHVVMNADGEVVFRFRRRQVVVDGLDHRGGELFRGETVASADGFRRGL